MHSSSKSLSIQYPRAKILRFITCGKKCFVSAKNIRPLIFPIQKQRNIVIYIVISSANYLNELHVRLEAQNIYKKRKSNGSGTEAML